MPSSDGWIELGGRAACSPGGYRCRVTKGALVLSGGGPIGVAWQSGMLSAFEDAGIDVGAADLILGTSAGSIVGSRIASGGSARAGVDRVRELHGSGRAADRLGTSESPGDLMQRFMEVMVAASELPERERLARIGAFALEAQTMPEDEYLARYAETVGTQWPRRFRSTAIDAASGEFVVWDETSGIGADRAVASSCAVPGFFPPVSFNGRRYYDGGLRSVTNADLAAGNERVLILTLVACGRTAPIRGHCALAVSSMPSSPYCALPEVKSKSFRRTKALERSSE